LRFLRQERYKEMRVNYEILVRRGLRISWLGPKSPLVGVFLVLIIPFVSRG